MRLPCCTRDFAEATRWSRDQSVSVRWGQARGGTGGQASHRGGAVAMRVAVLAAAMVVVEEPLEIVHHRGRSYPPAASLDVEGQGHVEVRRSVQLRHQYRCTLARVGRTHANVRPGGAIGVARGGVTQPRSLASQPRTALVSPPSPCRRAFGLAGGAPTRLNRRCTVCVETEQTPPDLNAQRCQPPRTLTQEQRAGQAREAVRPRRGGRRGVRLSLPMVHGVRRRRRGRHAVHQFAAGLDTRHEPHGRSAARRPAQPSQPA
jgi:hypothetical protein